MKGGFFLVLGLMLMGCSHNQSHSVDQQELQKNGLKVLDVKEFTIIVPMHWDFKDPGPQEDSFVGWIKLADIAALNFDLSEHGYANKLGETEDEYLDKGRWLLSGFFYKPGVTYISSGDVKSARAEEMKERGITDTSLVKVEIDPLRTMSKKIRKIGVNDRQKYPDADYIAELTYRGETITTPIELPAEIRSQKVKIDTIENYVIKTLWPKSTGKGMTGIYVHSCNSSFNFQMNGKNLSRENQTAALAAFKTIKFKRDEQ